MPGLLGDGQNFKRRDKDDKAEGSDCTSLTAM